jgi:hypothetical protein
MQEHTDNPTVVDGREAGGDAASDGGLGNLDLGAPRPARRIPPKLYRIGEVADFCGVSRQTIHNYTTMGLIREARWSPGGHRLYGEEVFGRIEKIARLKARRKTLAYIREHLTAENP